MPLLPCKLCGKLFSSSGGRTCSACHTRLDELYPSVREFLRDNPKLAFNVETVAEAMEIDIRYVQGLVDMGYLDRDVGDIDKHTDPEAARRKKLAQELESSLKQMKNASAQRDASKGAASYGQERYGDKGKK